MDENFAQERFIIQQRDLIQRAFADDDIIEKVCLFSILVFNFNFWCLFSCSFFFFSFSFFFFLFLFFFFLFSFNFYL
jgi:hypothetical protein